MNHDLDIIIYACMGASIFVLALETIARRSMEFLHNDIPHVRIFTNATLMCMFFYALYVYVIHYKSGAVSYDLIFCLFIILNAIASMYIFHQDQDRGSEFYFLMLSSTIFSINSIISDKMLLIFISVISWYILISFLAIKTDQENIRAEIALKMCFGAFSLFICIFIAFLTDDSIFIGSIFLDRSVIHIYFLSLSGMILMGLPPFHFAHVDSAYGSKNAVSFLLFSNSILMGTDLLLRAKDKVILLPHAKDKYESFLLLFMSLGLIIVSLRAMDQIKVKKAISYIASSLAPLFGLSLLFGRTEILEKTIFITSLAFFSSIALFSLYGSLSFTKMMGLRASTWEEISGIGRVDAIQSCYLLISAMSIAGIPGTFGYFLKLSIISEQNSLMLNLMIYASIAMGAAHVMRMFVFMFSKHANDAAMELKRARPPTILFFCSLILVVFGFFPLIE